MVSVSEDDYEKTAIVILDNDVRNNLSLRCGAATDCLQNDDDDNIGDVEEEEESYASPPSLPHIEPLVSSDAPSSPHGSVSAENPHTPSAPHRSISPQHPPAADSPHRSVSPEHPFATRFPRRSASPEDLSVARLLNSPQSSIPPSQASEFAAAPAKYPESAPGADNSGDEEESVVPTPAAPLNTRSREVRSARPERRISAASQAEVNASYEQSYLWYYLPPVAQGKPAARGAESPRGKTWEGPERQLRKKRGDSTDKVGKTRKAYQKPSAPRATRSAKKAAAPSD